MAGSRPVGPEDLARGQRFAALRATRWKTKGAFIKETELDRVRVSRLESGQDRFTSHAFQEEVAVAMGLKKSQLIAYLDGEIGLDGLRVDPPPRKARRDVEYDDVHWPSWRGARDGVRAALLKARLDADLVEATIAGLDQDAFRTAGDSDPAERDREFWSKAALAKYAMIADLEKQAAALARGLTPPIAKSQLGARVADELDDHDGYDPAKEEPAPHAQKPAQQVAGRRPTPTTNPPPKTRTRPRVTHDDEATLPVASPGKVTDRPTRAK